jgi:hypothetical protein
LFYQDYAASGTNAARLNNLIIFLKNMIQSYTGGEDIPLGSQSQPGMLGNFKYEPNDCWRNGRDICYNAGIKRCFSDACS